MNCITLISDWKLRDPYISILKSQIITHLNDIQIFDITHAIDSFHITQEAFILKSCFTNFPEHSVHLMLVGSTFNPDINPIIAVYKNHYFIGEDNGIFYLLFGNEEYNLYQYSSEKNLSYLEKIISAAGHIFAGTIQEHITDYSLQKKLLTSSACYYPEKKLIRGNISYIDACCNAISNIPVTMFEKCYKDNQNFCANLVSTKHLNITKYHKYYDTNEKNIFLLSNRLGYIEITMYQGNVAILADININDPLEIQF